jgi:hypothetical protein
MFDTTCTTAQYEDMVTDVTNCGGPLDPGQDPADRYIKMTIPPGHIGAHILFAWGQPDAGQPCGVKSCDIDVINVWEQNAMWDRHGGDAISPSFNKLWLFAAGTPPAEDTLWDYVNIDVDSNNGTNNINGAPMVDGPFQGLSPTFNINPQSTGTIPPPLKIEAGDTELGDNPFASMNIFGLFASLLTLAGLRRLRRKQ